MNAIQAGRRNFLCNLAVLTAGTAFGGVKTLTLPASDPTGLEAIWKAFCRQYGGEDYTGQLHQKRVFEPCKGHRHREGSLVRFPGEKFVAHPIWIYWESDPVKPADVIIHFYKPSGAIFSVNQFELKLLTQPAASGRGQRSLSAIFHADKKQQQLSLVKTNVRKNNRISSCYV